MRKLFLSSLFFMSLDAHAFKPDTLYYRQLLSAAHSNAEAARIFYNQGKKIEASSPTVFLGFKAMSEFMMCKYVSNPIAKLSHFNKGKRLLQQAIQKDSVNVELRFMRYCTQTNAPAMLDYNKELNADKRFLMDYLKQQSKLRKDDQALFDSIKSYLLTNSRSTNDDKIRLKEL